jgi:hypothetical protein
MSFIEETELKVSKGKRQSKTLEDQFTDFEKKTAESEPTVSRILRSLKTTSKGKVIVTFIKKVTMPIKPGQEANEEFLIPYTVKSPYKPHKDLYSAMKKLKKHALALNEIYPDDAKGCDKDYSVIGFNLSGDLDMQTARVDLILGKHVERTGKIIGIPTGQVALYENDEEKGGSDYHDIDELATAVEKVAEQVFKYIDGSYAEEGQLPLF